MTEVIPFTETKRSNGFALYLLQHRSHDNLPPVTKSTYQKTCKNFVI